MVEAGYHADALVVGIAVEHGLAEGDEVVRGDVVVLEHDALLGHGEGPALGIVFGGVAAMVFGAVVAAHVTLPVHLGHHLTAGLEGRHVGLGARPVLIEEEARGACAAHGVEDLLEAVRTVEEEDEDGHVGQRGLRAFVRHGHGGGG